MEGLLSDVRWTLRLIRRRPAFAATVTATLAVAIAAVVTAFGVATAVLWRPLPFADPGRLVFVWENAGDAGAPARVTGFRFDDWRRGSTSLESLAMFGATGFLIDRAGGAEIVNGVRVSTNYFDTLRLAPILGRTLCRVGRRTRQRTRRHPVARPLAAVVRRTARRRRRAAGPRPAALHHHRRDAAGRAAGMAGQSRRS